VIALTSNLLLIGVEKMPKDPGFLVDSAFICALWCLSAVGC
jgi:hypothetical protein